MSAPTTLAESWQAYADDNLPISASQAETVSARRAFMAGALAALTTGTATREQLLAECVQFGKAVGTAAERAP